MAPDAHGQTIVAIERAADVLSLFADADEPTLGVTEIAQALGLSKAVVYRILSSFRSKGFIELDETTRRYTLGPRALHLGMAFINRTEIPRVARPFLQALSRDTGETATLSLRTGDRRVYVDQVTPDRDVKMVVQLGLSVPLHAGASSKAFLAFLEQDEQESYLAGSLERLTGLTITNSRTLAKELSVIRERGFAESMGERMDGAGSVAAPVFAHDGTPAAVISVCGPLERFREEASDLAKRLVIATEQLSRRLGYRPATS